MKTAISIPDPLFHAAQQMARRLGVSRSHFIADAVEEYLRSKGGRDMTEKLNEIYRDQESPLDDVLTRIQAATLSREKW